MKKSEIQKHKGRLAIIKYKGMYGFTNVQSGEITAVTREHTVILINKSSPEIFKNNNDILNIISDKKEMEKFKDEHIIPYPA